MASVIRQSGSRKAVQFTDGRRKRRTISLGKSTVKQAEKVKEHVERLLGACLGNHPVDRDTSLWVGRLQPVFYDKLATAGIVPKREEKAENGRPQTLAPFVNYYITSRTDVADGTLLIYGQARDAAVRFFGPSKRLGAISIGDAKEYRRWLFEEGSAKGGPLAKNTVNDRCKKMKQFFEAAIEFELIDSNPFRKVSGAVSGNRKKFRFITQEETQKLIKTAPDGEWRLLIALCRYGGLRSPSETTNIKWSDVNWSDDRMIVPSPKTARYEGGESREIPIFAELRPYLEEAWDAAEPGAVYLIEKNRNRSNLRTRFVKIIRRAGLKRWPRVFHNLRASRQTELEDWFPTHVVCAWLGNSEKVAREHYLRPTDDHFQTASSGALQNRMQNTAVLSGKESQPAEQAPIRSEKTLQTQALKYTPEDSNL